MVKRLKITGRVQGIGFRYYMNHEARKLSITGWVRNCSDGGVEAIVSGTPKAIEEIIAWARSGPPAAIVDNVEISTADGSFERFETLPTE